MYVWLVQYQHYMIWTITQLCGLIPSYSPIQSALRSTYDSPDESMFACLHMFRLHTPNILLPLFNWIEHYCFFFSVLVKVILNLETILGPSVCFWSLSLFSKLQNYLLFQSMHADLFYPSLPQAMIFFKESTMHCFATQYYQRIHLLSFNRYFIMFNKKNE